MDSGVAAIVGAAVGAVGTGLAASVTGFWSAHTAKMQIAAQEAQGKRQLAFDKAREWRDTRKAAYSTFAEKAQQLRRKTHYLAATWRDAVETEDFNTLSRYASEVVANTFNVVIEGSAEAAEAAEEVSALAQELQTTLLALRLIFLAPVSSQEADERMREEWSRMHEEYSNALRRFLKTVWTDLGGTSE